MLPVLGSIFKERLEYTCPLPADVLKKDMEALFLRTKGWHFRPNLTGAFVSGDAFVLRPRIELGSMVAGAGTSISGTILPGTSTTRITITVAPNLNFVILFWFSLALGLFFCIKELFIDHKKTVDELAFDLTVVIPLAILALSFFTTSFLKWSFTKTFGLSKLKQ